MSQIDRLRDCAQGMNPLVAVILFLLIAATVFAIDIYLMFNWERVFG